MRMSKRAVSAARMRSEPRAFRRRSPELPNSGSRKTVAIGKQHSKGQCEQGCEGEECKGSPDARGIRDCAEEDRGQTGEDVAQAEVQATRRAPGLGEQFLQGGEEDGSSAEHQGPWSGEISRPVGRTESDHRPEHFRDRKDVDGLAIALLW